MARCLILFLSLGLFSQYFRRNVNEFYGGFSRIRVYSAPYLKQAFPINQIPGNYYIDYMTAKLLGRDGASTSDIRIIDKDTFANIRQAYSDTTGLEATKELQLKSSVVTFDRDKIQQDVVDINKKTQESKKENQTIIYLRINHTAEIPRGEVTSKIEAEGDNSNTNFLIIRNNNPALKDVRYFRGLPDIYLGQIHCHPMKDNQNEVAGSGTSSKDQVSAKDGGCNIYALESFKGGDDVPIDRITSKGDTATKISTLLNRFDFGLEALEYVSGIKK